MRKNRYLNLCLTGFIFAVYLLTGLGDLMAQTNYIIGSGTASNSSTGYPAPFGNYYYGARHQFVYRAAELTAAGMSAGQITAIAFNVTNTNSASPHLGFTVKMKNSATTNLTAWETGMTQYYYASSQAPVSGWNNLTLSTPFVWDGASNIVVEVCFNNSGYNYNASTQWTTGLTGTVARWYRADASGVCSSTSLTSSGTTRTNIRFTMTSSTPMSYSSSTVLQTTGGVGAGSTNQQIIALNVVTSGSTNPLNVTELNFTTDGTTNLSDISNAKVYYTGGSSSFSAINPFGSPVATPSGSFTVTGSRTLATGNNYFWLTYDISPTATIGNLVDAGCLAFTVGGVSTVPSVTQPAGARTVANACIWTLQLLDTYGDGWNGGVVNAFVDGSQVVTSGTVPSGYGPTNYTFNGYTGSTLVINWTGGSYPSENYYKVIDAGGTVIYQSTMYSSPPSTNSLTLTCPAPMAYAYSSAFQNNFLPIAMGSVSQEIIGLKVVTTGVLTPISPSAFGFSTSGSTNASDITNAKLYYSGATNAFSTATLVGSTANPSGAFTINAASPVTLAQGNNYFWLAYDISSTAVAGDEIDAEAATVSFGATTFNVDTTDPTGFRVVTPPLCGTYTIDPALPAGGNNFQSFTAAADALRLLGISCPVVFNVASGVYTEKVKIDSINGSSSVNTVTFQAAGLDSSTVTLQYTPAGSADNYTIWLCGADYVTFQYMTIKTFGNIYNANVIVYTNGANHNSFLHNYIMGVTPAMYYYYETALVYGSRNVNAADWYNVFRYNRFESGYCGIIDGNNSSNVTDYGLEVTNNVFINQTDMALNLRVQSHPVVTGNTIVRTVASTYSTNRAFGLHMVNCVDGYEIAGNNISISNATVQNFGMFIATCTGTSASPARIYNNFVSIQTGTMENRGIFLNCNTTGFTSSDNYIDNNSVNMYGTVNNSHGIFLEKGGSGTFANSIVRNNILSNTAGGYAFWTDATTGISSNYNNLYKTGTNLGHAGTSDFTTLAAWQATGQDANSLSIDPLYFTNTDLHTLNFDLNNAATPLSWVTVDIDGQARSATNPDMGADEFSPAANNAQLLSILSPVGGCGLSNSESVTLRIKNVGSDIITPGEMSATFILGTGTPVTESVMANILPGSFFDFTFSTTVDLFAPTVPLFFDLAAYVTLPGDAQTSNDSLEISFVSDYEPLEPLAPSVTVSYTQNATLVATPVNATDILMWYSDPAGTNLVMVNDSLTIGPLYDTATYYVQAVAPGGQSTWTFDDDLQGWTPSAPCGFGYNFAWANDAGLGTAFASNPYGNSSQLLVSPVVNVAGNTAINLSFIHRWSTESCCDEGTVYYRLDGGAWQLFNPTTGAYTSNHYIDYNPTNACSANSLNSFNGTSGYITSSGDINVAGAFNIELAFVFTSDGSVAGTGWFIDEVTLGSEVGGCASPLVPVTAIVQNIPANDAGVVAITSPTTDVELCNELVTVTIQNWGFSPITNFQINYEVLETGTLVSEILQDTVYSGGTLVHTFVTPADLCDLGTYTIVSYTSIAGDTYNVNDTATISVTSLPLVYCTPVFNYGCYYNINSFSTSGAIQNIVNNNSGCNGAANGYIYYPGNPLQVLPGMSFNFNINSSYGYMAAALWIDWNHDGDFGDANETVFNSGACSYGSIWSGLVTVPTNAAYGTHRLRVRSGYYYSTNCSNVFDPCALYYENGETEDYDIEVMMPNANDAALTAMNSPMGAVIMGSPTDAVFTLASWGTTPLTSVDVVLQVDGVPVDTTTWTGNLTFGQTATVTFPDGIVATSANFQVCGVILFPADQYLPNNTVCGNIVAIANALTVPYFDNFDVNNIWTPTILSGSDAWQYGTPAYGVTNSAHSEPNAWDVNLTSMYSTYANCVVTSPFFDFTNVTGAELKFWHNWYCEGSWDGTRLQYSTNGTTWTNVGYYGDPNGVNWYNYASINSSSQPAWSSSSSGWVLSKYNLAFLNNAGPVQFRFVFTSDGSVQYDGYSFDDFEIFVPQPWDASITTILQPTGALTEGNVSNVEVILKNNGINTFTALDINCLLNSSLQFTYPWTGSLATGETDTLIIGTVTIPAGNFSLCAEAILAGDTYTSNNGTCLNLYGDPNYEAEMVSIDSPASGCDLTTGMVVVQVKNIGNFVIDGGLTLGYQFNNEPVVLEQVTVTIPLNTIYTHTFTTPVNLAVTVPSVVFELVAFCDLIGDPNAGDDTLETAIMSSITPDDPVANDVTIFSGATANLAIQGPIAGLLYAWSDNINGNVLGAGDTFTTPSLIASTTYYVQALTPGGDVTWTFDDDLEDWTSSAPCGFGSVFSWNSDGGNGTAFANTPYGTTSQILASPVVNIPGSTGVTLTFNHKYGMESCCDEGMVYYRLDGGAWTLFNPASGGYNSNHYADYNPTNSCVSNYESCFTGNSGYITSTGDIPTSGASTLELAFVYTSDGSIAYSGWFINDVTLEGAGISCMSAYVPVDVTVVVPDWDAWVNGMPNPISGATLGTSETVSMTIYNNGLNAISNFPVSYTVNGGSPVTETMTSTILPGATYTYVFTTGADLSNYGSYTITTTSNLSGDQQAWNNSFSSVVVCSPPCTPSYGSNCTWGDMITAMTLGTINLSGIPCNGGYIDYTSYSTDLTAGVPNPMVFSIGYLYQYVSVWIDFDDSNSWDSDEMVLSGFYCSSGYGPFTANLNIPANANFGTHTMRVVDAYYTAPTDPCGYYSYGQAMDFTVNIIPDALLFANGTVSNVSCFGGSNGAIDVTVVNNGATPPYSFIWSNGATTEDVNGLSIGTYSVTVSDAATPPNVNDASFVLTQPTQILTSVFGTNVTTYGGTDGAVDLWVFNGTPPYTYQWFSGEISEDLTATYAGNHIVTVTDAVGCTSVASMYLTSPLPAIWNNVNTSSQITHLIDMPANLPVTIDGNNLNPGGLVGVFYDSLGTLRCGGYVFWNGAPVTLYAYGNNTSTPGPDGFAAGETFKWKVLQTPAGLLGTATACYLTSYPQNSTFVTNGLSGVGCMPSLTVVTQTIPLPNGWSMWSTYITPPEMQINTVMQKALGLWSSSLTNAQMNDLVELQVNIVKNYLGQVYWPSVGTGLNSIGNLNNAQGYAIKTLSACTLNITGQQIQPQTYPLSMPSGWSMISYLRTAAGNTATMMSTGVSNVNNAYSAYGTIVPWIDIIKNYTGQVYWPSINLNSIGTLKPGQGYQIKTRAVNFVNATYPTTYTITFPLTYKYPANSEAPAKSESEGLTPVHYAFGMNTGNNMSLGIPLSAWSSLPTYGDEVAVLNRDGEVLGSGVFEGENMAIAIWGDDDLTSQKEGFSQGEALRFVLWSSLTGTEHQLNVAEWERGEGLFSTDGISMVKSFVMDGTPSFGLGQNFPNPFNKATSIGFSIPEDGLVQISVYNVMGEKVSDIVNAEFKAGNHSVEFASNLLSSGSYYYRMVSGSFTATRQMILDK